jgi:hypothetical protein
MLLELRREAPLRYLLHLLLPPSCEFTSPSWKTKNGGNLTVANSDK